LKHQIESVLTDHPSYGHKRIALELKLNKKRIRRVMKKFGMKPYRRRVRKPHKPGDLGKPPVPGPNVTKILCPIAPYVVYVSDFTYIKFQERFIYLATVMDMFTREIIGWNISRYHNKALVLGALMDAIKRRDGKAPYWLHSDQGSEYDADDYMAVAKAFGITISMSNKASPWQNAFQESFYSHFKVDLGDPERFSTLAEFIEAIHNQIVEYNTNRIHTALKTTPEKFRLRWETNRKTSDTAFRKRGT
jgi:transposase InsO family protein